MRQSSFLKKKDGCQICVKPTRKTANQRPSSVWAYLMKQITSSYLQVPEDLQVFLVNLQVHLQVKLPISSVQAS
jgi:hypothetical protein